MNKIPPVSNSRRDFWYKIKESWSLISKMKNNKVEGKNSKLY